MTAPRLLHDQCRYHGQDCDRKSECLRHLALQDMGPRTPWTMRYCSEVGREAEGFIASRDEEAVK